MKKMTKKNEKIETIKKKILIFQGTVMQVITTSDQWQKTVLNKRIE